MFDLYYHSISSIKVFSPLWFTIAFMCVFSAYSFSSFFPFIYFFFTKNVIHMFLDMSDSSLMKWDKDNTCGKPPGLSVLVLSVVLS